MAIGTGDIEMVDELLNTPDVDIFYREGKALIAAAREGSLEMIELIALHPPLNEYYRDKNSTPVYDAVRRTINSKKFTNFNANWWTRRGCHHSKHTLPARVYHFFE